jgi:erythronate-4-phosphate dehydrogenase
MRVVVDDNIPYLQESLRRIADVRALPASAITAETVRDADALIVRTRTRCDASLLSGSRVRFIATATIGYDHIDTAWCDRHGIVWTNAPGCNASSVCQYVRCALLLMEREGYLTLRGSTLGIVGVGHVGSRVQRMAEELGMQTLCCDPPLAEKGVGGTFHPIGELAAQCDALTLHVPLTYEGRHATFHLADERFFASLLRKPLFINTSRGEVTHTEALKHALKEGRIRQAVVDVWEHEPDIDTELLALARITTPHIAGYSADGKARATQMSLDALCRFFHLPPVAAGTPPPADTPYDVEADSRQLKQSPATFEQQRTHYPLRRE